MNTVQPKPSADPTQEPPEVVLHRSYVHGCWCVRCGSHEAPIRRGLYSCEVPADIVAREVRTAAAGPIRIKIDLS